MVYPSKCFYLTKFQNFLGQKLGVRTDNHLFLSDHVAEDLDTVDDNPDECSCRMLVRSSGPYFEYSCLPILSFWPGCFWAYTRFLWQVFQGPGCNTGVCGGIICMMMVWRWCVTHTLAWLGYWKVLEFEAILASFLGYSHCHDKVKETT